MIPRNEHPNPQFERKNWVNLNGKWEFEIDKSVSGKARKIFEKDNLLPDQTLRMSGCNDRQIYKGGAAFISEYGGIKWDMEDDEKSWGYGNAPKTEEEFVTRYKRLTEAIMKCPKIMGLCYTQLYDVEQERNGLYTYSREAKFDMEIFRKINSQKAAIED